MEYKKEGEGKQIRFIDNTREIEEQKYAYPRIRSIPRIRKDDQR